MICHHYKCIFVHIPKNAGQSIEHVFLDLLELDWETRAPLLLRSNDNGKIGPPRLAHLKAGEYVDYKYLPQELFDQYFKFSFVRNPWSRMVSIYNYLGFSKKTDFKSFLIDKFRSRIFRENHWFVGPQSDFLYSAEEKLLVDYVGRFENLQADFSYVCQKIGIPPIQLPHINNTPLEVKPSGDSLRSKLAGMASSFSNTYKTKNYSSFERYQDYYDQESIDCVTQLYRSDIELFGYEFEG